MAAETAGSAERPTKRRRRRQLAAEGAASEAAGQEAAGGQAEEGAKEGAEEGGKDEQPAGAEVEVDQNDSASLAPPATGAAGWKGFCTAIASIMARTVEAPEAPVLCETNDVKRAQDQKTEARDKRLEALRAKALKDQGHTVPDITKKAFEAQLRKIATQGVVRLFNTLKDFQTDLQNNPNKLKASDVPVSLRSKKLASISKKNFDEKWAKRAAKKNARTEEYAKAATTRLKAPDPLEEFE